MREISYIILGVNMGLGHDGLRAVLSDYMRVDAVFRKRMQKNPGLVLFVNRARTAAKLFDTERDVLGYIRKTGSLSQQSIEDIAQAFGGKIALASGVKRALLQLDEMDETAAS